MAGPLGEREHGELLELASIEALGALDVQDRARLAGHLRGGCAVCLAELREGERTAGALAALALPLPAPGPLRARVLTSFADAAPGPERDARAIPERDARGIPRAREGRAASGWIVRAAGAAAFVALGVFALFSAGEQERERALRHQAELALARAEGAAQGAERERDRLVALVETIGAADTRAVALAGAAGIRAARGRAFVEPVGQRIVLLVYDLPPPPPGRIYQLWTIEGGVPESAGTFATSDAGLARHATATAARLGEAIVLAVTVEPQGGVPQPTGPVVLAQE